jgi:hypothetical protein
LTSPYATIERITDTEKESKIIKKTKSKVKNNKKGTDEKNCKKINEAKKSEGFRY